MDRRLLLRAALAGVGGVGLGSVAAACGAGESMTTDAGGEGGGIRAERSAYGTDPSQYGDLYRPTSAPRGVVVVIHGGFWKSAYGLEYGEPLARDLAQRGWLAWNIEYRRVGDGSGGGGGVPATLEDVTAAIAHLDELDLTDRPDQLDLAGLPVVGIGHSAGGHLATWAGAGGRLTHVISQAGVLDLGTAHDLGLGGGAVEAFLGHPPGTADADIDPIRMVPLAVPVWCVHGSADRVVPPELSRGYVSAAGAAGGVAELVETAGDHFAVIDPADDAWARTVQILDGLG